MVAPTYQNICINDKNYKRRMFITVHALQHRKKFTVYLSYFAKYTLHRNAGKNAAFYVISANTQKNFLKKFSKNA